jgi:mannose PTS system EIIA component
MTSNESPAAPVGILVIAHGSLAASLVECLRHVMGPDLEGVDCLGVLPDADPEAVGADALRRLAVLDRGAGAIVLTDLFGATPSNVACRLGVPGRIEVVSGINLPMLVRAYAYRRSGLALAIDKAVAGAHDGVVRRHD